MTLSIPDCEGFSQRRKLFEIIANKRLLLCWLITLHETSVVVVLFLIYFSCLYMKIVYLNLRTLDIHSQSDSISKAVDVVFVASVAEGCSKCAFLLSEGGIVLEFKAFQLFTQPSSVLTP